MADASTSVFQGDLPIGAKLERARGELLDLSARNRLLNVPRFSKAARTIEVVDERSPEIFRMLVRENKALTFAPGKERSKDTPEGEGEDDDEAADLPQPDEDEGVDDRGVASRHSDTKLQTRMTSKGLQKRLLDLYGDARTLEEEQGVNVLYLALGMLKWVDPLNASNVRHAPLILIPVRLERGAAGERFRLRARLEDLSANLSLEAFLDRIHKLKLPPLDPGDDFESSDYLAATAAAIETKENWEVRPNDIVLGFFSFSKFLMYRDLDPANWPVNDTIADQPMIRSLLADGFEEPEEMLSEDTRIDDYIPPAEMLHIVDSDSSQTLAVHDVRQGRDLVIQGPPGTGKSQTISNVIAAAVADGKTVLFVAEKMAALDVVKRRLDMAGIGDVCLELHSNKANKRSVLEELRRTWDLGAPKEVALSALTRRLTEARDILNAHAERLHQRHAVAELTPYQVFGQLARLKQDGCTPVEFSLPHAASWTPEGVADRVKVLTDLAERIEDIGLPCEHPWRGVALDFMLPPSLERLMARLAELVSRTNEWNDYQTNLSEILETAVPSTFAATDELMTLGRRVAAAPKLDTAPLGGSHWGDSNEAIISLIDVGREFDRLSTDLHMLVVTDRLDVSIEETITVLDGLPKTFGHSCFKHVAFLNDKLPQLLSTAARLDAELGRSVDIATLLGMSLSAETGERVAAAPDASPEAFAATVWDHGVEQAGDLAGAVAALERARGELGDTVNDAAWTTDLSASRQALATYTGVLRRLNADWRKANALVRTIIRTNDLSLSEILNRLDILAKGQAALRAVKDGDTFGKAAFGADWRGDRSVSAPLVALVDWMRTLRGLGAEPRLIASRVPKRSAVGQIAHDLRELHVAVRAALESLRKDANDELSILFGNSSSLDYVDLRDLAERIRRLAIADNVASATVTDAVQTTERLSVLRQVAARQVACRSIDNGCALGVQAFGSAWQGRQSNWIELAEAANWINANADIRGLAGRISDRPKVAQTVEWIAAEKIELLRTCDEVFASLKADAQSIFGRPSSDLISPSDLIDRLSDWIVHREQLSKWVAYRERSDHGRTLNLDPVIDRLQDGRIAPADTIPSFEMAYFETLLSDQIRVAPELGRFDGTLHGKQAQEFATLDKQRVSAASFEVVRAHHRGIPAQAGMGPVGVLRGEIARRRGHMPIRQLVQRAGPAIQALKPVMMMSPLSVAQFLVPGHMTFDLLVMDEASQIQPVDALGAVARCRQVVVVGDEQQLPPTRFFARMTGSDDQDDEEGASVADIESILGLFKARGLPQRMLRWHYRSRHESLIAVSNRQFYESKLFIVPSPYTREAGMGLSFRHVPDGMFESRRAGSGTGTNLVEAKLVAAEIICHARTCPEQSLGVATFSSSQRRAIQDEVEILRRTNPDCEGFFSAHPGEPFFIKNLENVQGDERDVIMISVGYGRGPNGTISMRFGPLGAEGGERRLNVLISRAKRRCEVFASITDEDIDLERAKGKGVYALKLFLHYARTGQLNMARQTGRDHDSVLEEQIGRALQEQGYQVHYQVGIAGFFIDLAIADPDRPGRYVLGIECDGAAYHSSRSARDRDRLRQSVLEDHGWIIHRVWGSDWFQRPTEQLGRIADAVEAAKAQLAERESARHARGRAVPASVVTVERADVTEVGLKDADGTEVGNTLYQEAAVQVPVTQEMHEVPSGRMAELVEQIVSAEGPVHIDEVVVRLRTAWGLQRAGSRIHAAIDRACSVAVQRGRVLRDGPFLSMPGQAIIVRDRSLASSSTLRRLEMLPPAEVNVAVVQVIRTGLGAGLDEITAAVPRLLGFKAVSAQLRQIVRQAVDELKAAETITKEGALFVLRTTAVAEGPSQAAD